MCFKDKKSKKCFIVVFYYKLRLLRLRFKYKGVRYVKGEVEDDEDGYFKYRGKGWLFWFIYMRRRYLKIKEVLLLDEEEDFEGYRERKFDDFLVEVSEDDDSIKVWLLRKLCWFWIYGYGVKICRCKSLKFCVVVYDDDEEEK